MSFSEIDGYVKEIKSIDTELIRLKKQMSGLRIEKATTKTKIANYLKNINEVGIKSGETLVMLDTKNVKKRKKNIDKQNDSIMVCEKYGVKNSKEFLKDLTSAMSGNIQSEEYIKFK